MSQLATKLVPQPVRHTSARPIALDAVLRELTQRFAEGAERHDRDASFAHENFAELQRHGLIASVVPVVRGGGALATSGA